MPQDITMFEDFLASKMREKGINAKRLAEATGISLAHLENLLHGNFDEMPSAPYFRGYLLRIGKVLDFNGEEWWETLKKEGHAEYSNPTEPLPSNRFEKKSAPKYLWPAIAVVSLFILYFILQLPRIFGKPALSVSYPPQSPFTSQANTITLAGTVKGADALYLSNGTASSSEEILIAPDGSWQKTVLLQNGPNTFELLAKKFLGAETSVNEEIIYNGVPASTTATSSSLFPTIHQTTNTPATGSYFN